MLSDDVLDMWERQPGETLAAYLAFCAYRDLGSARSLTSAYRERTGNITGSMPGHWRDWSTNNSWVARCRAFDIHCDREARKASEAKHIAQIESFQSQQEALSQGALTAAINLLLKSSQRLAGIKADEIKIDALPRFFRAAAACAQAASDAGANVLGITDLIKSMDSDVITSEGD